MVELTSAAAEKLQELRGGDPARAVLRVYVAGRSCCATQYGLAFDEHADEDDTTVELAGIAIAVDPLSKPYVEGATIDYIEADAASGFMVRNAALEGAGCACGRR